MTAQMRGQPDFDWEAISNELAQQNRELKKRCQELEAQLEQQQFVIKELTSGPPELNNLGLTKQEARMFSTLAAHPGLVFSKEQLLAAMCFDYPKADWPKDSIVGVLIHHIRKKLQGTEYRIINRSGLGYLLHVTQTDT